MTDSDHMGALRPDRPVEGETVGAAGIVPGEDAPPRSADADREAAYGDEPHEEQDDVRPSSADADREAGYEGG